jgi:hypothetical protein
MVHFDKLEDPRIDRTKVTHQRRRDDGERPRMKPASLSGGK